MKKQKNHSKIYKIDGVGINLERFYPVKTAEEKNQLRLQKGFSPDDFILIYTAEFIPRKNHKLLFDILPELRNQIPCLKVVLCGKGELLEQYERYAAQHNMDYITFTGYTGEVDTWYRTADILFMPSFQEGLPVSMIEAVATGLPVVASKIRGHVDVIEDKINGFLCDIHDTKRFIDCVVLLYKNSALRSEIAGRNVARAQLFSVKKAVSAMGDIYRQLIQPERNSP